MPFTITHSEDWPVEAPTRRDGKPATDRAQITVTHAEGTVGCPVILTSDLHHNAADVLQRLAESLADPSEWTLLAAGDMAGAGVLGSDGDSVPLFENFLPVFARIFFVQGNHDLPTDAADGLRNADGSRCHVHNRRQEIPGLGAIAGVDGIIGKSRKPHRLSPFFYELTLNRITAAPLTWLLTHEPPQIPEVTNSAMGSDLIRDCVLSAPVANHVFGHCHFKDWHGEFENTHFIGIDGRILCIRPRA